MRALLLLVAFGALMGQPRVGPENWGERVILVVPMVGAGSYEDPRRPLVMPRPSQGLPAGVVSIRFAESDDGRSALVEVVARDKKALELATASLQGRGDVQGFDKGRLRVPRLRRPFRGVRQGLIWTAFFGGSVLNESLWFDLAGGAPAAGRGPAPLFSRPGD